MSKINLDLIPYENKKPSKDEEYISLVGESESFINGTITDKEGNILSVPFIEHTSDELILQQERYRLYTQGTHVKLFKNKDEWILSTINNPRAENSHYMNPSEKFGYLFDNYGGQKFKDMIEYNHTETHHFILVTKALTITSKNQNIYDNECIIVYIGSTYLNGIRFELKYDDKIFFCTDHGKFLNKQDVNNRIYYPTDIEEELAYNTFYPFYDCKSIDRKEITNFFGENIMVINEDGSVTKCIHHSYENRYKTLGGTCLKKKLWDELFKCKDCYKYDWDEEKYKIGTPDQYCIQFIKTLSLNENYNLSLASFYCNHIKNNKIVETVNQKLLSVLMFHIMIIPREKVLDLINYYEEYFAFELKLCNFIKTKGNIIFHKRYIELFTPEKLNECENVGDFIKNFVKVNEKSLGRISDIYSRSRPQKNEQNYQHKFTENINKMIYNEINIYKIYKTLKYLN